MEIKRAAITIRDLCDGYINESEADIEKGVYAYGGKLCVRPAFQRSFVYDTKQANAVINTALKGFPLNVMYWVDNGDGTYDCLDGQQRTISLCNFVDGSTSFEGDWLNHNKNYIPILLFYQYSRMSIQNHTLLFYYLLQYFFSYHLYKYPYKLIFFDC